MRQSESIAKLATALAKVQGATVIKDSSNPHFKSKYADLPSCIDVTAELLRANGLSVITLGAPGSTGSATFVSRLVHESGEWLESEFTMRLSKDDPQGFGSAFTYARRYALSAWCNLAAEDDDGNAASTPAKPKATKTVSVKDAFPGAKQSPSLEDYLELMKGADSISQLKGLYDDAIAAYPDHEGVLKSTAASMKKGLS